MPMDLDALRAKKNKRSVRGWSPKEGVNLIRVLPHTMEYFSGKVSDFAYEFRSHFLKSEGVDTVSVRCLRDAKKPCPFCDLSKQWKDSTNVAQKKVSDDIRSGERHLMNILHLTDPAAGIQQYETGPKVYDLIMAFAANPGWGDLFSIDEGRNIELTLTPGNKSKTTFNDYQVIPQPDKVSVKKHLGEGWEEKIDLLKDQIVQYPDQETVDQWMAIFTRTPVAVAGVGGGYPTAIPSAVVQTVGANPVAAPPESPFPGPSTVLLPKAPEVPSAMESPVVKFAISHGRGVATKGPKIAPLVPDCFSEGEEKKETIGYNPLLYPCEDGCPVKVPCQMRQLNLE